MKPNIATANGLTRGQESSVLITIAEQMGCEDIGEAVKCFLRGRARVVINKIVVPLRTIKIPARAEKFVVMDRFKLLKDGGFCSSIDGLSYFFSNKTEEAADEQELLLGKLDLASINAWSSVGHWIIEDLGGEKKAETTLAVIWSIMSKQPNGENGDLSSNRRNIFFVRDIVGVLRFVCVEWDEDRGGWRFFCYSIDNSDGHNSNHGHGYRVFSRKS